MKKDLSNDTNLTKGNDKFYTKEAKINSGTKLESAFNQDMQINPNADIINKNIKSLTYDPLEILAFQGDKITSFVPRSATQTGNKFIVVTKTKHKLSSTFDIAVPNARKDITYPGALLLANQKLVEGMPDPLVVDMKPRKVTIDLPGLTDDNSILVENYDFTGVSAAINKLTNNWLETKSKQFKIAANTEFKKNILYDENSMALNFGVDVSYVKDKLGINFEEITDQKSSAYLVQFRQIFYTVSAELPKMPADVFGDNVKWEDISSRINNENPPAYVQNVQYGREVYLLLQSSMSSSELKGHLDSTLEFSKGSVKTKDDLKIKEINKHISCTVITIGGAPKVITGNLGTDNILKQVNDLISANVDFTPGNQPLPIAYTVAFLKDNKIASIQGTTEYITTDTKTYTSGILILNHSAGFVAQFKVYWEEVVYNASGQSTVFKRAWDGNEINRTLGFTTTIAFPPNARNIHVKILDFTGLVWDPEYIILDQTMNLINKRTITISGTTLNPYVDITPTDEGQEGPPSDGVKNVPLLERASFNFINPDLYAMNEIGNDKKVFTLAEKEKNVDVRDLWYGYDKHFEYKAMKYLYSCFPCSINVVLANLGYVKPEKSEIEDLWNALHPGGLNMSAPSETELHEYLMETSELSHKGLLYTPSSFETFESAEAVKLKLDEQFLNSSEPVGIIGGIEHAQVFYKTDEGRFIHFVPSTDAHFITCEYVLVTGIEAKEGRNGEFAVVINYYCKEPDQSLAAHFLLMLK